uniref:Putative transmembrane protein n=1 Tax=Toxoplasma gondii COUG TaxID=1074873 RepID=A0A2G8XXN2_TOXGO|nr:putative transmembrane protein [Toxoplasma gondii COUG]
MRNRHQRISASLCRTSRVLKCSGFACTRLIKKADTSSSLPGSFPQTFLRMHMERHVCSCFSAFVLSSLLGFFLFFQGGCSFAASLSSNCFRGLSFLILLSLPTCASPRRFRA